MRVIDQTGERFQQNLWFCSHRSSVKLASVNRYLGHPLVGFAGVESWSLYSGQNKIEFIRTARVRRDQTESSFRRVTITQGGSTIA